MEESPCYLLNLPNELQKMIFDKIEPQYKGSFGRCSRKCRKIWQDSKSAFDAICWEKTSLQLVLSLSASYPFVGGKMEFNLVSNKYRMVPNDKQFKKCKNSYELAQKKFAAKLEKYQKTVKSITIYGECPITLRKVRNFPDLQYLHLSGDYCQFYGELLTKIGTKLKYLKICSSVDYSMFDAIYEARDFLWIYFELNREQLLRLSAKDIEMPMGNLKAEDIFDFIQGWLDGTRVLDYCKWNNIEYFDARKLFWLFNARLNHAGYKRISIRGPGLKAAILTYNSNFRLSFKTIKDKNFDWNYDSDGETYYRARAGSGYKFAEELDE